MKIASIVAGLLLCGVCHAAAGVESVGGGIRVDTNSAVGQPAFFVNPSDGKVGLGTAVPARTLHISGSAGMRIDASGLPGSPATGDIVIDSGDSNKLKWYDGSAWLTGGGGDLWSKIGGTVMLYSANNNLTVQSTVTVQGNAFSVGGSTFVIKDGWIGMGTTSPSPYSYLDIAGPGWGAVGDYGIVIPNHRYYAAKDNAGTANGLLSLTNFNQTRITSHDGGFKVADNSGIVALDCDPTLNCAFGWSNGNPSYFASRLDVRSQQNANNYVIAASSQDSSVMFGVKGNGSVEILSTASIHGNAFSVGASTLVVKDGMVGIGLTNPSHHVDIYDNLAVPLKVSGWNGSGADVNSGVIQFGGTSYGAAIRHNAIGASMFDIISYTGPDGTVNLRSGTNDATNLALSANANRVVVLGTMTVVGNAMSVGVSTLVVKDGMVGVGLTNPAMSLDNRDIYGLRGTTFAAIGPGQYTIRIGTGAGHAAVGANNTLIGASAGNFLTTGDNNTCIGKAACLNGNSGGQSEIVAIGAGASGGQSRNTLVGYKAGNASVQTDNVYLGWQAGMTATSAYDSTLVGSGAGQNMTTGHDVVAVGFRAGYNTTNPDRSVFIGATAGYNSTGQDKLVIDSAATARSVPLISGTFDTYRIGIATGIPQATLDVMGNLAVGSGVDKSTLTGNAFSVGVSTLAIKDGRLGIGTTAPISKLDVADTWALSQNGYKVASSSSTNAFFGYNAGVSNLVGAGPGQYNSFIGYEAGTANTTGNSNTCVGYRSGYALGGAGNTNTLIGSSAGYAITTGDANTCIGENTCATQTTVDNNTAVGYRAGLSMTGTAQALLGAYAGYALTSGNYNTLIGYNAGAGIKTGASNVVVGNGAGGNQFYTDGSNNTVIGKDAGYSMSGSGNILLGYNAGYNIAGSSNTLVIENSNSGSPLIWGDFATDSVVLFSSLTVNGTNGIRASSLTLTGASGTVPYDLTTSSGIHMLAGELKLDSGAHVKWADGSVSTSAHSGASGGGYTQAVSSSIFYLSTYSGGGLGVPLDVQRASITTTGKDVNIFFDGAVYQHGGAITLDVRMDGAAIANFPVVYQQGGSGDFPYYMPISRHFRMTAPSAGTHGFYVSMDQAEGLSKLYCLYKCVLEVTEIR
ncbi:MAG: hypothetical protein HY924_15545 [Elusimicrobia bacterium]|nr:hypothetical protein [Elusimicrobiota bacterium]